MFTPPRFRCVPALFAFVMLLLWAAAAPAAYAHDIPRSHVTLRVGEGDIEAEIDVPIAGLREELPGLAGEARAAVTRQSAAVGEYVAARVDLKVGGRRLPVRVSGAELLPGAKTVRVRLAYTPAGREREAATLTNRLFASAPVGHQTFITVYRGGTLEREGILRGTEALEFTPGERQSGGAVFARFVGEGVRHIFIGPDHILFIVGLMLLGGSIGQLLKIATAFTLAHSITLTLAATGRVAVPSHVVEPVIALSIVFVGLHFLWERTRKDQSSARRDLRLPLAFGFGLIHGFGFAGVLAELSLPPEALGLSLFSFNVGVEIGQACIVGTVAPLLAWAQRRNPVTGERVPVAVALLVILAGAYWFGQRVAAG